MSTLVIFPTSAPWPGHRGYFVAWKKARAATGAAGFSPAPAPACRSWPGTCSTSSSRPLLRASTPWFSFGLGQKRPLPAWPAGDRCSEWLSSTRRWRCSERRNCCPPTLRRSRVSASKNSITPSPRCSVSRPKIFLHSSRPVFLAASTCLFTGAARISGKPHFSWARPALCCWRWRWPTRSVGGRDGSTWPWHCRWWSWPWGCMGPCSISSMITRRASAIFAGGRNSISPPHFFCCSLSPRARMRCCAAKKPTRASAGQPSRLAGGSCSSARFSLSRREPFLRSCILSGSARKPRCRSRFSRRTISSRATAGMEGFPCCWPARFYALRGPFCSGYRGLRSFAGVYRRWCLSR